jgi:hypothetical protein
MRLRTSEDLEATLSIAASVADLNHLVGLQKETAQNLTKV